jgi:hypothetical protein
LAIVSINNRTPLHVLGDPARLALLAPLRDAAREALATIRGTTATRRGRPITFARPAAFAGQLDRAGLRLIRAQPFGFGPFTMLGRELLPGPVGVRLERRLQRRAEAPDPGLLGYLAAQYLVSAERATD